MEFTEELVNLKLGIIHYELVPERVLLYRSHPLIITNDLLEIPGEREDICMLLFTKCHVDTQLFVFLFDFDCSVFLLL